MSDFLNHLVERTLSATDVVHPRTLSIFEPPPTNGGAFFRGSEETDLPASERRDRLSQLQSLWRTGSPEAVTGQFVPAPPKTDPASLQFPSARSLGPERADLSQGQRERAASIGHHASAEKPKTGKEEVDASRTESPGALRQMRPRVGARAEDRSVTQSSRESAAPDRAERSEEGVDSSRSKLPGFSPQVRPPADFPSEQQTAVPAMEDRGSADAVGASPQVRPRADPPGKQPNGAPLHARRTNLDRADEQGADELQTQLPPGQAPSQRGPVPRRSTNKHSDELAPQKIIPLGASERGLHRDLVPGRDVRAVSPRPPPSRPLPAPRSPKNTPAPPSINVTIGRVEVRATLPPRAPSQAPRASSPIMNLEEYLRQRAGGNRT
jgi:hypothetical protein